MRNKIILMSLLLSILSISEIQAASFDCSKAKTARENLICSDKELSEAEEILNKEYKAALQTYPYKEELKQNQKNWAKLDAYKPWDKCTDARCLLRLYRERIALIRTRYSKYFYGGDKFTGEYKWPHTSGQSGDIGVILIPGNKIIFNVFTISGGGHDTCGVGESDGNTEAIATFIDKNHAVFVDNEVDECEIMLTFNKNKITVSFLSTSCMRYCGAGGYMTDDYFKTSNKPIF